MGNVRRWFTTAVCLSALTVAALMPAASLAAQSPPPAEPVSIDLANAPVRGPAESPITIVMFTDFGNPACGSTGVILQGLLEMYPERLRIVFKHNLPAGQPDRMLVHEAARAAEAQGKFWEMHDLLLANQARQSRADLIGMATQLGLDVPRFVADLDAGRHYQIIEADRLQATALGIKNQPTWFLNGVRLKGPVTLTTLQRLIDAVK